MLLDSFRNDNSFAFQYFGAASLTISIEFLDCGNCMVGRGTRLPNLANCVAINITLQAANSLPQGELPCT